MGMTWPCTVDYSYVRPGAQAIHDYGAVGAMRYLGDDSRCIFAAERDELLGAGLGIGLIWESSARRPCDGYQAGVDDAYRANAEADQLGAPGDTRIYYAVDFQPTTSELTGPVSDYFWGVVSVGGRPSRAYGCASVMQRLCGDLQLWPDSWQCAAWSYPGSAPGTPISDGGYSLVLSPYAHMLQNIGYVMNDSCDHNSLVSADVSWMWGLEGTGDWFDMATKEDLEAVVRDVVASMVPSNLVWQDDEALWEVLVRSDGSRIRRRIVSPKELDLLSLGRELTRDRVVDLRGGNAENMAVWNSWPAVEQELAEGYDAGEYDDDAP